MLIVYLMIQGDNELFPYSLCKSKVEVRFWVHDLLICMCNLAGKNDDPESLLILLYASLNMY